jgi:hypothetical protein
VGMIRSSLIKIVIGAYAVDLKKIKKALLEGHFNFKLEALNQDLKKPSIGKKEKNN